MIGAEERGRLRAFKREVSSRAARLDAMFTVRPPEIERAAFAFTSKRGVGRVRALAALKRMIPAHYEAVWGDAVIWSSLAVGNAIIQNPMDLGQAQPSVTVGYVVLLGDRGRSIQFDSGLWTLEIPDHALVRLFQRRRTANPGDTIWAAHTAIMAAAAPSERAPGPGETLLVPTPGGAFAVNLVIGRDATTDDPLVYFRARTWLSDDMLGEGQVPLAPGVPRLGDTLLVPRPLRTMTIKYGKLTVEAG